MTLNKFTEDKMQSKILHLLNFWNNFASNIFLMGSADIISGSRICTIHRVILLILNTYYQILIASNIYNYTSTYS
jgi:hypothetical protein